MLSFFKINDPYRLISIFLMLLIFRMPAFLGDVPLLVPELNWMLIGEKLSSGSLMYVDLMDNISPLAALVYWVLDTSFGRSPLAYHIVSLLLVMAQAIMFNMLLMNNKAYHDSTYIPALIYALLMNSFFDFYTLSPVLMSITFLLPAINHVFRHMDSKFQNLSLLPAGLYLGMASLFYLPCFVFILPVLLAFVLFTGTRLQNYILFLYGFFAPYLLVCLYFFWFDGLHEFIQHALYATLFLAGKNFMQFQDFLLISAIPVLFVLFSFFKIFEASRYTSYQIRYQQVMFFLFVAAAFTWFFSNRRAPYQMIIFVPAAAFFISHYFLLIKRKIFAEGLFLLLFLFQLTITYGTIYKISFPDQYVSYEKLIVKETAWDKVVKGKKILFLGDNISVYKDAKLATPFLNWRIAREYFLEPSYYDNITTIFARLEDDLPEVIIDNEGVYEDVFSMMPVLERRYAKGEQPGTYLLQKMP